MEKMSENQESTSSGATVNNYFVNLLELGSEATNPDLVYVSIPNLPSTYFFTLNSNMYFSDLSVRVLSQRETEQHYRQRGRHDQVRTYQRMMRTQNRRARR